VSGSRTARRASFRPCRRLAGEQWDDDETGESTRLADLERKSGVRSGSAVPFLYHARPPNMLGETLYPLNELRSVDGALYERAKARYKGREAVLEFRIPLIDVLWNDTLHLSTIHPSYLAAAWREVGLWTPFWERLFFQIPLERVAGYPCVWFASESYWVNNSPNEDVPLTPPLEEFRPFDPTAHEEPTEAPPSYYDYLRRQQRRGRPPLQFPKIPHVLVPGPIDAAGLELVRANV
jgi:hypothetical protein